MIKLVITLLNTYDSVIFSCIGTAGIRDRKIPAGILYITLQKGLPKIEKDNKDSIDINKKVCTVLIKLIRSLLHIILSSDHVIIISKRSLIELFTQQRDFIIRLGQIATILPPTLNETNTFESVLKQNGNNNGNNDDLSPTEILGIEARRLFFILLADQDHSPLLSSKLDQSVLVKAMLTTLCNYDMINYNLEIRKFVIYVLNTTPILLPKLFRMMSSIPDYQQQPFDYILYLNTINTIIRQGPIVIDTDKSDYNNDVGNILLPNGLKRQNLTKALQSNTNHLVVLESTKLLIVTVKRCQKILNETLDDNKGKVSETLYTYLPDVRVLIGILSSSKLNIEEKSHAILYAYICEAIRVLLDVFPKECRSLIDWTKLLPNNVSAFIKTPNLIQKMVLSSIRQIATEKQQFSLEFHPKSFCTLLQIMVNCRSKYTYNETRSIAMKILCTVNVIESTTNNTLFIHEYEATCWLDGITNDTIEEFSTFLNEIINNTSTTPVFLSVMKAWNNTNLDYEKQMSLLSLPSTTLVGAIQRISRSSQQFVLLSLQVVTRCLLCNLNPLPLAAVIIDDSDDTFSESSNYSVFSPLLEYANSLVKFQQFSSLEREQKAKILLKQYFSKDFYLSRLLHQTNESNLPCVTGIDSTALAMQLAHLAAISDKKSRHRCLAALKRTFTVSVSDFNRDRTILLDEFRSFVTSQLSIDASFFELTVLSGHRFDRKNTDGFVYDITDRLDQITRSNRQDILFFYLIYEFCAPKQLLRLTDSTMKKIGTADLSDGNEYVLHLVSALLRRLNESQFWMDVEPFEVARFADSALHAWYTLTTETSEHIAINDVVDHLENFLCVVLSRSFSALALNNYSTDLLIKRCLQHKSDVREKRDNCLLATFIEVDYTRMAPSFLSICSSSLGKEYFRKKLSGGVLDNAFCGIFRHTASLCISNFPADVLSVLLKDRVVEFTRAERISKQEHSVVLHMLASVVEKSLPVNNDLLSQMLELMMTSLSKIDASAGSSDAEEVSVQGMILHLSYILVNNSCSSSMRVGPLALLLFVRLCEMLPYSLRIFFKKYTFFDQGTNHFEPELILRKLCGLLSRERSQETKSIVFEDTKSLFSATKSCLRYGLGHSSDSKEEVAGITVRLSCIQFVDSVVSMLQDDFLILDSTTKIGFASQTFAMVTSHSKIRTLLSSEGCEVEEQLKMSVLQLMLSCIKGAEGVEWNTELLDILVKTFNASVSKTDMLIRAIINLVCRQASQESKSIFLDQIRWGNGLKNQPNYEWDWLADSFELHRVYKTLDEFPVYDDIDPFLALQANDNYGELFDKRYSPGFVLPMIFASLEEYGNSTNHVGSSAPVKDVLFAHRMCQKGALALALASLCSQCLLIRKLSISILMKYMEVVESNEAVNTPSWRDRPQLAMLLNAVHRALVMSRAEDSNRNDKDHNFVVPRLPGFSAIFLARSSLILARPNDHLFVAVNRLFLHSEVDSGAFHDLTRLPAFISLFCSSTNNTEQLLVERRFALKLVKDGVHDGSDFKHLLSCHCPDLMLTSLPCVTVSSSTESNEEKVLLLETLVKLVTSKNRRPIAHLMGRMNILAWLRSLLLDTAAVSFFLDKISTKLSFLKLLVAVVEIEAADNRISDETFSAATEGVAHAVLSLVTHENSIPSVGGSRHHQSKDLIKTSTSIISTLCKRMKDRQDQFEDNMSWVDYSHGIELNTSLRFCSEYLIIKILESTNSTIEAGVSAICTLPVKDQNIDYSIATKFCEYLSTIDSVIGYSNETKTIILRRIMLLISHCQQSLMMNWESSHKIMSILPRLLGWWPYCSNEIKCRDAWFDCIDAIILCCNFKTDDDKREGYPAKDFEKMEKDIAIVEFARTVFRNNKREAKAPKAMLL